ncbi:orotidine-5'-phosphate decarboxylase [Candidatus Bipolaricaulota bacterium]|nr:orotidine-5'-phosphate decarboxylase [Candidatus Bipolaricaulota bacterium]
MFIEKLEASMQQSGGNLCVGLDPHRSQIPERFKKSVKGIQSFLDWIIDETAEHACAYKPNSAFYEALGSQGWDVLGHVIERVHRAGRPVILDAKRGDIASTAAAYASAAFDVLQTDAITLVPYMGSNAITPFLQTGGFAFVLTLPSNPSSRRVVEHGTPSLAECVATLTVELAEEYPDQLGMVVGATHADAVARLDDISGNLPWLVPGIGAQGGQADAFFAAVRQKRLMVVNASRSILFAPDPKHAAKQMKQDIKEAQID